ncbi:MAG: hypothetical protein ACIAQZ_11645 [Sedimentisphaeraceae bacterium JB056]
MSIVPKDIFSDKIKTGSPLVETTPFVFDGRLYLLENWRKMWDYPIVLDGYPQNVKTKYLTWDIARVRDIEADKIISVPMVGMGFCSAFVDDDRVYVFGSKFNNDKTWNSKEIWMCYSDDLFIWSHPECILEADEDELFFNINVCKKLGGEGFVLLVETDAAPWPKFTFRFLESENLTDWSPIDGAIYGDDKYVGGPAIYTVNDFYYVCYLDEAPEGWITRIARSKDLKNWQDAPKDKPVLMYNKENDCHRLRGEGIKENNVSDLELCEFNGKTLLYFTGGDQLVCGDLQYARYPGSMQELFESFFN